MDPKGKASAPTPPYRQDAQKGYLLSVPFPHAGPEPSGQAPRSFLKGNRLDDLVQLATSYQIGPGRLRYHDFDKAIRRVAGLHSTSEEYVNLFPFVDAADSVRRTGTSKYLMSPFEAGYEGGRHWRRAVQF